MKKVIWKIQFIFWSAKAGQKIIDAYGFSNQAFAENNCDHHHLDLTPKQAGYEFNSWASK